MNVEGSLKFSAISLESSHTAYAACTRNKSIVKLSLKYDGAGVRANVSKVMKCEPSC